MLIKKFNDEQYLKPKNTKIYCVFSGCGKTFYSKNEKVKSVLELDKDQKKFLNFNFPNNYTKYLKENIGRYDIILVSTHKEIRDFLIENNIDFTLVYPNRTLKEQYKENYFKRGSTKLFVDIMDRNWDKWIDDIENQNCNEKIELQKDEYLSDLIK